MATFMKRSDSISAPPVKRLVLPMVLVMLGLAMLLLGVTVYSGRTMDEDAIARQQALIDNAFTTRLNRAVGELRSVAWWDDTVTYSAPETFDTEWLDREIGSYMYESYHHDRLIIFDERNRPVYVYGEGTGLGTKQLASDLLATATVLRQARGGQDVSPRIETTAARNDLYEIGKTDNRKYSRGFGAIISIDGKPALATALLITPSYDVAKTSPTRRIALSIIDITQPVLTDIGRSALMPDLSFRLAKDKRLGSFQLDTDNGKSLTRINWTPKQPGTEMVQRVLPGILAVIGAALTFLVILMIRLVASTKQLAAREADARFLADHDALTGLPNRRRLESLFMASFDTLSPVRQKIAVACVDLDRFKDINDTLGHNAGDELIKAVAARLRSKLHLDDTLARLGGDEFAIMRPIMTDKDAGDLADMIADCFSESFAVMGHLIEANASTGLAFATRDNSFGDAIKRADIALYDAKANGRGRMSLFTTAMSDEVEHRHSIQIDLRRALSARELTLNYQPIVEASSGAITSVEALLRWNSPTHGSVPPDLFVSIAEEVGLMAELGRFVIEQAIEDARRWPDLTTAINISPAQLRSATILSDLLEPAKKFGVAPSRLTIEITESVLMSSDDRTLRVLNELKRHGFTLALDDFGTGYSSLAYIRDFPFDKLKIDRSFVQGLNESERALAIVEGVVKFGKILGREIVAEGIETEEEMAAMQAAGATHLQGYLFSRALPADHIEAIAATFGRAALAPNVQANGQGKRTRPARPLASAVAKPASKTA
jgi:diguanylate cyclase (GGDEF)-like protein